MNISVVKYAHPIVLAQNIREYLDASLMRPSAYDQRAYVAKLIETAASIGHMSTAVRILHEASVSNRMQSVLSMIAYYAPMLSPRALIALLTEYAILIPHCAHIVQTFLTPLSHLPAKSWHYKNALVVWICIIEKPRINEVLAFANRPDNLDASYHYVPNPHDIVNFIGNLRMNKPISPRLLNNLYMIDQDTFEDENVNVLPIEFAASYWINAERLTAMWDCSGQTYDSRQSLERIASSFAILERDDMLDITVCKARHELDNYTFHEYLSMLHCEFDGSHSLGSIVYTLTILHADGYLKLKETDNSSAARFLKITSKLPLILLQKVIDPKSNCNTLIHWINNQLLDHFHLYF